MHAAPWPSIYQKSYIWKVYTGEALYSSKLRHSGFSPDAVFAGSRSPGSGGVVGCNGGFSAAPQTCDNLRHSKIDKPLLTSTEECVRSGPRPPETGGVDTLVPDERWAQIKSLFESAISQDVSERDSFLAFRCGSDDELRREVQSLALRLRDPAVSAARARTCVLPMGQHGRPCAPRADGPPVRRPRS